MQLINSMLSIQLQYVRDPEAADLFRDSINRIEAMALIHNDLYKYTTHADINFAEFIPKLLNGLRSTYNQQETTLMVEAEDIHLGIDDAIPCALILNELISNSLSHAFPGGSGGTILVKMFFDRDTRLCNLIVHDDGKGLPGDFDFDGNTTTFGLLMVKLLSSQLGGSVCFNSTGGTEFTITFPIKINQEHSC